MSAEFSGLDLPIPAGQREEWARRLAEIPASEDRSNVRRLFLFRVGAEWFGIEPSILSMTMPYVTPRRIPHQSRSLIDGLVNADGRVIACISLERFAATVPGGSPGVTRRWLVFAWKKWPFAVRADEVLGVDDVDDSRCDPLPSGAGEMLRKCARGIVFHKGRAVICLENEAFSGCLMEALR